MRDTPTSETPTAVMPNVGFEIVAAMTRSNLHAMSEWNREMAKFVGHRLEEDARLQDELSRCCQPFEAFEVFARFMHTALLDYASETRKLQAMSVDTTADSMAAIEDPSRI